MSIISYWRTLAKCLVFGALFFRAIAGNTSSTVAIDPKTSGLAAPVKPNWLTDLSLTLKESYDDNVFVSGVDSKYFPRPFVLPNGSVVAEENKSSWVMTLSPKIEINLAPLIKEGIVQTLSAAYTPDFVTFHETPSENYQAHRFTTVFKGRENALSFGAESNVAYIDGSDRGPTYPGALYNSLTGCIVRERRKQLRDRAAATFQYDLDAWFIRPAAALLYYDLMTEQINLPGYQSYADRYDINGGADLGWKIAPQVALTLGYRYGHQYQQQFFYSPYSASSDYQRTLIGIEGKPWTWLDLKINCGPDFRSYAGNSDTHITPLDDLSPIEFYGEMTLAANVTAKDVITFRCKDWQWVSSIGKIPYFESTYELNYRRVLSDKFSVDLNAKYLSYDFTAGNLPSSSRFDTQYSLATGLRYAVNQHLAFNLNYSIDLGGNGFDGIPNPATRAFKHQIYSVGAWAKF